MAETDQDILTEARDHMSMVMTMESEIREERRKCARFLALKQWNEDIATARGDRPTLTIDQTRQYVFQVVNDWRRNRLGIKVSPGDDQGDDKFAELIEGDIRQCEYQSKAQIAYDWAVECMTGLNAGFVQVYTKRRPGSFKKDFWIAKIPNPDCVYMDQFCQEPDYSDQRRCLKAETLSLVQYKQTYGNTVAVQNFETYVNDQSLANWITKAGITVGEWWKVIEKPRKIQLLTKPIAVVRNGQVVTTPTVYDNEWTFEREKGRVFGIGIFDGVEVAMNNDGDLMEDDEPIKEVWQYILNGVEVLSKTRWEGSMIPIIPFLGREQYFEGKKRLLSMISGSLDTQQAINYAISSLVERLGQFPKNPYIGITGQFNTDQKQWAEMNRVPRPYLQVDPVKLPDGTVHVAMPMRNDADPRIDQFINAEGLLNQLLKGTIGMYGASLGDREGKARSGVAERTLQQEGDNASFDFLDNGGRGIELVGKVIVDAWPKVRMAPDTITIRDANGKVSHRRINEKKTSMARVPKDQDRDYMVMPDAQYHVTVSAAPSSDTKRQEDAAFSQEFFKELPPEQQVKVAPVMLRHQESTVAHEMADVLDPPKDENALPPQVLQAMQVAQQTIKAQADEIHSLNDERDAKKLELEADWRKSCLDAYVKIRTTEITASKDLDKQDADIAADRFLQVADHAHEVGMAAMEHAHTLEQGQQAAELAPEPEPEESTATQ